MSEKMYDLRDMLCEELDKVTDKGSVTRDSLDVIDKLTHSIKSLDTILAMEESGYSNGNGYYYDNYSDARGRGRNAKRDSRGRYSSAREGRSYRRGYSDRSYDRGGDYSGSDDMVSMLEDMMDNASDSRERETIKKMMDQFR